MNLHMHSATVPVGDQSAAEVLAARRRKWEERPLTREVYRRYFEAIRGEFATGGRVIEIGGGAGNSREFISDAWVSDFVWTPFVDFVADAVALPAADGSVDNLFMVDVLHHVPRPGLVFREAARVLRRGGRMVVLEPYVSLASRIVLRAGHPELIDEGVDPLPEDDRPVIEGDGPFAANQAIPTLMFFRELARFEWRFPELKVRTRRLDSVVVYPLSGGFSGPVLAPWFAHRLLWGVERLAAPLRRWMAFRMLVTLERV